MHTKPAITKLMEENPMWTIKCKKALFDLRNSCSEKNTGGWESIWGKYNYILTVFLLFPVLRCWSVSRWQVSDLKEPLVWPSEVVLIFSFGNLYIPTEISRMSEFLYTTSLFVGTITIKSNLMEDRKVLKMYCTILQLQKQKASGNQWGFILKS